mgnify:CR=1 FL=1
MEVITNEIPKLGISIPILIPFKNKQEENEENNNILDNNYLQLNMFNPNKGSPPNLWKLRLKNRINNYCKNSSLSE